MEKTIVLALATGQKRFSSTLSKLVENYAELLASQGLLTTAMEYLKLLGSEESSHELAILRDRIALSANIETGTSTSLPYPNGQPQPGAVYDDGKSSFVGPDSQYYYQPQLPQQPESISRGPYGDGYQHHPVGSYGGYPQVPQKQPYTQYTPAPFQPPQTTHMFVPTPTPQIPQPSFTPPVPEQPTGRPFNPSTPPALRNVEQYQQPTLGSQLYSGGNSHVYQPGPPGPGLHGAGPPQLGAGSGQMFSHAPAPAPGPTPGPRSFMPVY